MNTKHGHNCGKEQKMMSEETLIARLKEGDEAAYKQLFKLYYPLLCRFATALLGDRHQAEIVVDDVVFALWQNRLDLDIRLGLRSYLMAAVRNRCLNELHSRRRRMESLTTELADDDNLAFLDVIFSDPQHPLGQLIEKELEQKISQCVNSLPAECRTVFEKSRYEQKSNKEIAAELGISINTVKYHIKHALALLHSNLDGYLRIISLIITASTLD